MKTIVSFIKEEDKKYNVHHLDYLVRHEARMGSTRIRAAFVQKSVWVLSLSVSITFCSQHGRSLHISIATCFNSTLIIKP